MKKCTFILLFLLSLTAIESNGQKRAEIKLYNTALENGDLASFKRFLAKYPESVFAAVIQNKIDSVITAANTTQRTAAQATEIFSGFGYKTFLAAPYRRDNIEYILGIARTAENIAAITLRETGTAWEQARRIDYPVYTNDPSLDKFSFVSDSLQPVTIENRLYFAFVYKNTSDKTDSRTKWKNGNIEIIFNLCPAAADSTLYNAMFAGETTDSCLIEGNCMEATQSGAGAAPQMDFLLQQIKESKNLVPFSNERAAQKNAISNWYKRNPEGAEDLTFIAVNKNNPIVDLYKESKYTDKSNSYSAALIECMQTTLICVYANETSQYLLVWCEPAVDKEDIKAKYLNTIYFEGDGSLVLYYDQNRKMIKERINIPARKKQ